MLMKKETERLFDEYIKDQNQKYEDEWLRYKEN